LPVERFEHSPPSARVERDAMCGSSPELAAT
jgi:hypothetical protein